MCLHILFTKEDAAIQRLWGCCWRFFALFIRPAPRSSTLCHMRCRRPSTPPLLRTALWSQNPSAPYVPHRATLRGVRKGAGKEKTWTFYFSIVNSMAGLLWRVMACWPVSKMGIMSHYPANNNAYFSLILFPPPPPPVRWVPAGDADGPGRVTGTGCQADGMSGGCTYTTPAR